MSSPDELDTADLAAARPRRRLTAWLVQRWHRTAGVAAAAFLVFLALTGVLLMHSDRLGLPTAQVENRWVLDWYGIRPPPPPVAYQSGGHWFSQLGEHLYVDTTEIPFAEGVLLGVFANGSSTTGDEWLLITDVQALVVDGSGTVLERFGRESGLPAGLTAAGRDAAGQVVLASGAGRFRFDATLGEFVAAADSAAVHWSSAGTPPAAIATAITHAYRGDGLSLERLLLDLHSGRLFGTLGVVVVNLAALLLLFLAASGLYLWSRRAGRHR
ncbi:MAG: PepSY domain-containing protein [Gammaproteobacteria bacterium]|nr:PepSY domain-containing protein [Gammaproteobacteria bacterium]